MSRSNLTQGMNLDDWHADIKSWVITHWNDFHSISDDIVSFFEVVFEHTRCPDRAWFGVMRGFCQFGRRRNILGQHCEQVKSR